MKITRIQYKLSASYLLILVVSMAITTLLFLRFVGGYVERRLGEQLRNQVDFMATFLSQYNTVPDPSDLPMAMNEFQTSFADVLRARLQVTNSEGMVMSDTHHKEGGTLAVPDLQAALTGQQGPWSAVEQNEKVVHATAPIRAHGEVIGLVDLSTPLEDQTHLQDLRDLLLLAFGVSLLVSWTISSILSRSITQPIAAMKEAAVSIARGELTRSVGPGGYDELADLGQAINRMAIELQSRIQEAARERSNMSTLLESLVDGVVALDGRGRISFLNSAARRLLEFGTEDVLQKRLLELWPNPELPALLQECQNSRELVHRELSSAHRRLQLYGVPYDLQSPTTTSALGVPIMIVVRDVTELRRLEEVRSTFLSSVSHELRTPLTIIKGYAVTLEDSTAADPRLKRSLEVIDRETDRLTRLVDDVLELSRLRSHRLPLERVPQSADAVVEDTVQSLLPRASDLGVGLQVRTESGGVVILADADRLRQIVMNLVDNGLKYTPDGGEVRVETRVQGRMWRLEVIDSGVGIAEDDLPHLFERFFRGRDGRKKGVLGSGLGLAIVRELVELHDGTISVESELNRGTRIWVDVPVYEG